MKTGQRARSFAMQNVLDVRASTVTVQQKRIGRRHISVKPVP